MWNAGYPELEAEYEIQLAFSLSRKNVKSVYFSVSAVAFSVECFIFLYRLYAESISLSLHGEVIRHLFFQCCCCCCCCYCENVQA